MRSSKRYGRGLIRRVTKSSFHNTYKTPLSPPLPKLLLNIHNHSKPKVFFIKPNTLFSSSSSSFSLLPTSTFTSFHNLTTIYDHYNTNNNNNIQRSPDGTDEEVEPIDLWEEEDDAEPEIGDGADGGGIALQNCLWGERALSIAREVLLELDDDIQLYAFKTSPKGYIYVRLDKLSHEYGCPSMEEIECYSRKYKQRLDDVGASGEIPDDLALEVSSPSAERLLRVPEDLHRFKEMPMRVFYVDELEGKCQEKDGAFLLDVINIDLGTCTWRLANVKENRDPLAKGRPMSRKQRDWRLEIPFTMSKRVTLYLDYC